MSLTGKTAIVTGASRGIGRAVCVKLSQLGANIVVNFAGNREQAEETCKLCEGFGVKAIAVQANVADMAQCEALFKTAEDTFGSADILINNAGITRDTLLMRMSQEDFDSVISINLKGAFNCTKLACRPMFKKRAGRIVNITSVVGITGNIGQSNYAASKAGLIGFTKASAKELALRGITVNAVAPGFIETDMTADLKDDIKNAMLGQIPLSRPGKAEDVANAAAFLCSEEASYITGQVLCVDGGMVM